MSSLDSDGFFNKGVMCDTFKTSGKEPDSKEKLTMFIVGFSNTSRQDFNNLVGKKVGKLWQSVVISPHPASFLFS